MTLFELVKQNICVPDAAEQYGLQVNRNGMCSCPFHVVATSSISLTLPPAAELAHSAAAPLPTKSMTLRGPHFHPSMKLNERYFYCFGCGATGDVIDFVARLFGLSSFEAVQKLAQDFGIDPDKPLAATALPKAALHSTALGRAYFNQGNREEIRSTQLHGIRLGEAVSGRWRGSVGTKERKPVCRAAYQ